MANMFVNGLGWNKQFYRGPTIDASYQVSVHLATWFQRRFKCKKVTDDGHQVMAKVHMPFGPLSLKINWTCLNKGKLEVQWAEPVSLTFNSVLRNKQFQRRFFRNRPIRNKNCLWQPCLCTDRYEMSNLYRGPSINASYKVPFYLTKRFKRRRFFRHWSIRKTRIVHCGHVC